jgi:hypothetical protein
MQVQCMHHFNPVHWLLKRWGEEKIQNTIDCEKARKIFILVTQGVEYLSNKTSFSVGFWSALPLVRIGIRGIICPVAFATCFTPSSPSDCRRSLGELVDRDIRIPASANSSFDNATREPSAGIPLATRFMTAAADSAVTSHE